ncbi:hypothetical protein Ancab_023781 [Ancistrocladus abbreviatus]
MSDNISGASPPQFSSEVAYPSQREHVFHVLSISPGKDIICELKSKSEELESDLQITSGSGRINHADMAFGTIMGSHELINLNGVICATGVNKEGSRISATLLPSSGGNMMGGLATGTLIASSNVLVTLLSSPPSASEPNQSFSNGCSDTDSTTR